MKPTTTLIALLASTALLAQPTLEFSDVPTGNTSLSVYQLTDPGNIVEPSTGANQTWDFSSGTFAAAGNAVMGPSAGTPYAASYPAANWTWAITPTVGAADYLYLVLNSSGMENVASHVPTAPNVYTNYQRIMQFPIAFGASFVDAFTSPDHSGTDTWTYAGHGTLITPIGTFTDQVMMVGSDDDIVIWNASPLYPRVIANEDGVTLFGPGSTGVAENGRMALGVFPVPASTTLTITGTTTTAQWSIVDLQGRTLLAGRTTDMTRVQVDIAELAEGEYLLTVLDAAGRRTIRFQKR
jgi:hypothetical protein